jgi:hypothetical protein
MGKGMILVDIFSCKHLSSRFKAGVDDYHRRTAYLMKNLQKLLLLTFEEWFLEVSA